MKLESMTSLYTDELRDMLSAEKQLIAALPKMAKAASHPRLIRAFQNHLEETKGHFDRLNAILDDLGAKIGREKCEAMAGLIHEGKEVIDADGDDDVRDAALIVAAQKVEHYEIAGYGSLCVFAKMLGRTKDAKSLGQILDQEKNADTLLTEIAESQVNTDAADDGRVTVRAGSRRVGAR